MDEQDTPSIADWVASYASRRYTTNTTSGGSGGSGSSSAVTNTRVVEAWRLLLNATYGGSGSSDGDASLEKQRTPAPTPSAGTLGSLSTYTDSFSLDGLCRTPSLTLQLYHSPDPVGVMAAWSELLLAAVLDPTIATSAAFKCVCALARARVRACVHVCVHARACVLAGGAVFWCVGYVSVCAFVSVCVHVCVHESTTAACVCACVRT